MRLLDAILSTYGNDARSEMSAESIRKIAKASALPDSACEIIDLLNTVEAKQEQPQHPFMSFIHATRVIMAPLAVALYYLTGLLPVILLIIRGALRPTINRSATDEAAWDRLYEHWGRYPFSFLIKAVELECFRAIEIQSPSFEIGVYQGATSTAHFADRPLDVGMEFVPAHLLNMLCSRAPATWDVHANLLSGDIYKIPIANEAFRTVLTIHSIDDMERGLEGALNEINRVMEPGGRLILSTYSSYFARQNIFLNLLEDCGLGGLRSKLFDLIYVGTNNLLDEQEWRQQLQDSGYTVERYEYFFPHNWSMLLDLPFRIEGYLMNLFGIHNAVMPFRRIKLLEKFYRFALKTMQQALWQNNTSPSSTNRPGMNVFIVAKKSVAPSAVKTELTWPENLKCPNCNSSPLIKDGKSVECRNCQTTYPVAAGIPVLLSAAAYSTDRT